MDRDMDAIELRLEDKMNERKLVADAIALAQEILQLETILLAAK